MLIKFESLVIVFAEEIKYLAQGNLLMFNCHLVALLVALMRLTTMLFKLVIEEIRREG